MTTQINKSPISRYNALAKHRDSIMDTIKNNALEVPVSDKTFDELLLINQLITDIFI